ncbi:hypothetical protein OHC50_19120 [Paenarthrobacter ilicis]|uniref:hypothetical protein n=1 Tax=Paenarthrobacter ilicis TaxID=43665 RepID=UPI00300A7020
MLVIGPLIALHYGDFKKAIQLLGSDRTLWGTLVVILVVSLICIGQLVASVAVYVPTNPG